MDKVYETNQIELERVKGAPTVLEPIISALFRNLVAFTSRKTGLLVKFIDLQISA
jgi:hypothetical protein